MAVLRGELRGFVEAGNERIVGEGSTLAPRALAAFFPLRSTGRSNLRGRFDFVVAHKHPDQLMIWSGRSTERLSSRRLPSFV